MSPIGTPNVGGLPVQMNLDQNKPMTSIACPVTPKTDRDLCRIHSQQVMSGNASIHAVVEACTRACMIGSSSLLRLPMDELAQSNHLQYPVRRIELQS